MNDPIKIIDKKSWNDAVSESDNFIGDKAILGLAADKKLIVIDEQDRKFLPIRVGTDTWELEPIPSELPE